MGDDWLRGACAAFVLMAVAFALLVLLSGCTLSREKQSSADGHILDQQHGMSVIVQGPDGMTVIVETTDGGTLDIDRGREQGSKNLKVDAPKKQ